MALPRTDLIAEEKSDTSGEFLVASSAFTPPDNSIIVATVRVIMNDTITDMSLENSAGLTFTRRVQSTVASDGGYSWNVEQWTAPVVTGASMTITSREVGSSITDARCLFSIIAFTGYDTGTPTGGTAAGIGAEDGTGELTLSAAPETDDVVVASVGIVPAGGTNTTSSPGAGCVEVAEIAGSAGYGHHNVQTRTGSTSTSVVWTDINVDNIDALGTNLVKAVALVIKAAAAGGISIPVVYHHRNRNF